MDDDTFFALCFFIGLVGLLTIALLAFGWMIVLALVFGLMVFFALTVGLR